MCRPSWELWMARSQAATLRFLAPITVAASWIIPRFNFFHSVTIGRWPQLHLGFEIELVTRPPPP
jgi:hypothetical protein